jgi:hypothetical protein
MIGQLIRFFGFLQRQRSPSVTVPIGTGHELLVNTLYPMSG